MTQIVKSDLFWISGRIETRWERLENRKMLYSSKLVYAWVWLTKEKPICKLIRQCEQ